jgi:hypothetical protein
MKFPAIVLAVIAVTIGAPAMSNAQAARPGMPTPNARESAEQSDHDHDVCGVNSLRGTYVFAASGFNIVAGVAQPKAIVEVVEFNGDGTLSVPVATVSLNGLIVHSPPGIGTYTVADDCSGTILFAGPAFDIVLSRDGEVIWMIQTNPNSVFQGTATRTSRGRDRH